MWPISVVDFVGVVVLVVDVVVLMALLVGVLVVIFGVLFFMIFSKTLKMTTFFYGEDQDDVAVVLHDVTNNIEMTSTTTFQ